MATLEAADRLFGEGTYNAAAAAYRELLARGDVPANRLDDVEFRVCESLGKGEQWDAALETALAFYRRHSGTVWEMRVLVWLAQLHCRLPDTLYRVTDGTGGTRLLRGHGDRGLGVPANPDGSAPASQECAEHNGWIAHAALEAALVRCPQLAGDQPAEEIGLCVALVQVLIETLDVTWELDPWRAETDPPIEPEAVYDPEWTLPRKMLYLFARIRTAAARHPDTTRLTAASLVGEAVWLSQYQRHVDQRGKVEETLGGRCLYQDRDPEEIVDRALAICPSGRTWELALASRASLRAANGNWIGAAADFGELAAGTRSAELRMRAKGHLEEITRKELSLVSRASQLPGRPAQVTVTYRNLQRVHYTAYPFDLAAAYAAAPVQPGPEHLTFPGTTLNLAEAERYYGKPAAQGWLDLPPGEPHCSRTEQVSLALQDPGAYAVAFRAAGVRATCLVIITELALVHLRTRAGGLLFAASASTGRAWGDCQVLMRRLREDRKPDLERLQIGAEGILRFPDEYIPGWRRPNYAALAVSDGQLALTGWVESPWRHPLDTRDYQAHGVTDRPVYRPGQAVRYRLLVMHRKGSWWGPVSGRQVTFRVEDPAGAVVEEARLGTDEWGSVSGEFLLSADAPLGRYRGRIIGLERGVVHDCQFQVEEYRKPEFAVTVTPAAVRVKPGEEVCARVYAVYYWGAPVADAEVSYRVYQEPHSPFSPAVGAGWWNSLGLSHGARGELIRSGTARTGKDGSAELKFETQKAAPGDSDYSYRVEVEVRDASRRTISGEASVRVSSRSLYLSARSPHVYVSPGTPVDVEIAAADAEGRPVSISGFVRVYRQFRPEPGEKEPREEQVHESPQETDAGGKVLVDWLPDRGGSYRVAFETRDPEADAEIAGSTVVWVRGATGQDAPGEALALRMNRQDYREGETARLLVTAPREGCSVLLLRVAGQEIQNYRLLDIPEGELETELPLGAEDVPGVQLQAVCLGDGDVYTAYCDLSVQPAVEPLTVEVRTTQDDPRPSETARLQVRVRDREGRPVAAALCLTVSDAALAYIQRDLSLPIHRTFVPVRRPNNIGMAASGAFRLPGCSTAGNAYWRRGSAPELPAPELRRLPGWFPGEDDGEEEVWPPVPGSYRFDPELLLRCYPIVFGSLAGAAPAGAYMVAGAAAMEDDSPSAPAPAGALISEYGPARDDPPTADAESVRQEFADTAYWSAAVYTDAAGEATVEFTWPDNLTEWRAFACGNTREGEVGEGETRVRTSQEVVVRPETPRFLVEGDTALLSAVVHNYLEEPLHGHAWIRMEGAALELDAGFAGQTDLELLSGSEARVDWRVHARRPGIVRLRMGFQSGSGSDAAEVEFPVLVRGARVTVVQAGELRESSAAFSQDRITVRLPEDHRPGSARLIVRAAPSLVGMALDALPYLIDYPYGCIEQTVSRFVPAVLTGRALAHLGVDLESFTALREAGRAAERTIGAPEPVEYSPYTYAESGRSDVPARLGTPVLTHAGLDQVVRSCLKRLRGAANRDGGWGWWPDRPTTVGMTAYVVGSLQEADAAGWTAMESMVQDGQHCLASRLKNSLQAKSAAGRLDRYTLLQAASVLARAPKYQGVARNVLLQQVYPERERLTGYGHALLALALHETGNEAEAVQVLRNLLDRVRTDPHAGTAWWDTRNRSWYWYENGTETAAAALRAMLRIDPSSRVAPMVVRWLVQGRRGMAWHSTQETALVIRALLEYAEAREELAPDYVLTLSAGTLARAEFPVRGVEAVLAPIVWEVPDELLHTGEQELVLEKRGTGALYYSAALEYFSVEERTPAVGHGLTIRRHYYRKRVVAPPSAPAAAARARTEDVSVRPNPFLTGDLTLLDPPEATNSSGVGTEAGWERVPLREGEPIRSGELLKVELTLETDSELGYVLIEEIKPAGCEPEDRRSGLEWVGGTPVYRELRDQKIALFLEQVPHGRTTLSYLLRAETPGVFTALPAFGYAMYTPEFQSLSEGRIVEVSDMHGPGGNQAG